MSEKPASVCGWCRGTLEVTRPRYCSKRCRQTAWRMRQISIAEDLGDTPKRLAYADPPYPGLSRKYYGDQPSYAGEVDHAALIASLTAGYDGWALSTSARALRDVLPLCPPEARVAAWVKPSGAAPATRGAHNLWEPVIYMPARLRQPGFRDWASFKPARGGDSTLIGRKPIGFCAWMFQLIGASPVDSLDDMFPGSGVVGRAWGQFCASAEYSSDASARAAGDVSPRGTGDASVPAPRDSREHLPATVSPAAGLDASPRGIDDTSPPGPSDGRPEQLTTPSPRYRDDASPDPGGDAVSGSSSRRRPNQVATSPNHRGDAASCGAATDAPDDPPTPVVDILTIPPPKEPHAPK